MFSLVKTILRLIVAALIIFFVVSLWSGGEKFRWYGEKLGDKADSIKGKMDEVAVMIKKLTGVGDLEQDKKPVGQHHVVTHETSKEKTKKTDDTGDSGQEGGNKPSAGLWDTLWKKIKALTKE